MNPPQRVFPFLFDRHGEWLSRFFFLFVEDPLDAEDLAYEYFIRFWDEAPGACGREYLLQRAFELLTMHDRRIRQRPFEPIPNPAPAKRPVAASVGERWDRLAHAILFARLEARLAPEETAAAYGATDARAAQIVQKIVRTTTTSWPSKERSEARDEVRRFLISDEGIGTPEPLAPFALHYRKTLPVQAFRRLKRRLDRERPSGEEVVSYEGIDSPIGRVWIATRDEVATTISISGLHEADFVARIVPRFGSFPEKLAVGSTSASRQLLRYFDGALRRFTFPYRFLGATQFQSEVWSACAKVEYGQIRSYKDLAEAIEKPGATRAVGGALSRNPLPIVVPCHRILASNGRLHGFSGGLDRKGKLLAIEGVGDLFASSHAVGEQ
ncbi:MAG: methylated-DNA--[protein]-cysteine S-methyltransferase [Gemmatimonadetes bacterium]|nr:methylated-DNA--[protein]-cysteine S-methyltransferase [Gemmatimonadota bacterium]